MRLRRGCARVEKVGERSLIFVDGALTHAVQKVPAAGDYRVQDDYGASDHPVQPSAREVEFSERALALAAERCGSAAPLLYGRVDFLEPELRGQAGPVAVTELVCM